LLLNLKQEIGFAQLTRMARILALDYGGKRTGLAATDTLQIIASPIGFVPTDQLPQYLSEYFGKEEVEEVVIGYPTRLNGQPTDATPLVEAFVDKFRQLFPSKRIVLHPEQFTSQQASQAMVLGGMKKKDRRVKGHVDMISATLILQAYLETKA
jgi:putative Holliday junction resolvase